jgi:hypothetical protein
LQGLAIDDELGSNQLVAGAEASRRQRSFGSVFLAEGFCRDFRVVSVKLKLEGPKAH